MKRRLKKFLIAMASLYVIIFVALYFLQGKMIFLPDPLPKDYVYKFSEPFEEITLTAADGAKLNAIHFKKENPKGVILYFHGNAGNLSRWGLVVQNLTKYNYDVLVMDFRGYGKSTGKLSEEAFYGDAQLCYNYLLEQYPESGIVVYGRSLGTTFATYVAAKNHPKELILEAPFYNLDAVASSRFPVYPVSWFLKYHFPTNEYLRDVECPVIIFHGTDDHVVNYQNSVKLSKLESKDNFRFITIAGGSHHNLEDYKEYKKELDLLLKE